VLFGFAPRSAATVDRSRARIPLLGITGAIPRQKHTKGKTMSNTSKPAAKVTIYPITAAIWRNEKDGRAYYNVTFERSFKDDAGNWRSASSFNTGELLLLAKVADQAHTEILQLQASDRQAQQTEERAA
jgi:hypothetical protein